MRKAGCVENRCFEAFRRGRQEARAVSEGSHLAHGFYWHEINHGHVCVFCFMKTGSLKDRVDHETVGVMHTD